MDRSSSIRQHHAAGPCSGARRSRLSIDLRAHRPALDAIAKSRCMPLAVLVRTALADWLASRADAAAAADASSVISAVAMPGGGLVKVTLRMPARSAANLAREARAAEMSQGFYVAQLVEGLLPMPVPADLQESRRALLASTATLAALCSDLRAFERGMSQVRWVDLAACKAVIDPLPGAVSRHLALSSSLLAELKGPRRPSVSSSD